MTVNMKFNFELMVQSAGDAIIAVDSGGAIIVWNPAAERIFGFSADEALGHKLDLIIPERYRARHWEGYRKAMAAGSTRYASDVLRVPAVHKDGRPLSIAFTVALLSSADGQIEAVAAIVRDETARWKEEQELRRRLAELERQST